jgi:hypothetical protein
VWDVTRGPGEVESVGTDGFVVAFSDVSITFRSTGHGGFSRRTLYWADPVPSPPSKDPAVRELAGRLYHALYDCLKGAM